MKKILPFIALLSLCFGCAPPKKISEQQSNSPSQKHVKHIPITKQIAPKTCSLVIKDCVIISKNKTYFLNGRVDSIKAYGAGFTEILQNNQSIRVKISEQQAKEIGKSKTILCSIAQVNQMNNKLYFELLRLN